MTLPYNVYITEDDVLSRGYNLSNILHQDDQGTIENTIRAFLEEVGDTIYNLVLETISNLDIISYLLDTTDEEFAKYICTSEDYESTIAYAQLVQALYILENGNLLATTGEGTQFTIEDLRGARAYAPSAISLINKSLCNFLKRCQGGIC